jgi:uncharacterized coiled-coil DUF342 family protein
MQMQAHIDADSDELLAQLTACADERDALRTERDQLRAKLDVVNNDANRGWVDMLRGQDESTVQKQANYIDALKQQIKDVNKERDELKNELDGMTILRDRASAMCGILTAERDQALAAHATSSPTTPCMQTVMASLTLIKDTLVVENATLRTQLQEAEEANSELDKLIKSYSAKVCAAEASVSSLKYERDEALKRVNDHQVQANDIANKLDAALRRINDYQVQSNDMANQQRKTYHAQIVDLEDKLKRTMEENTKLQAKIDELQPIIDQLLKHLPQ